jgi:CheY-like chemotaxis protein
MSEAPAAVSTRGLRRERAKLVVIDDDTTIRTLLKLHLVNAGYDVLAAADAVEGGYLVIGTSPDLIICDVNMPYMDGYDFVAALKSDPLTREIPVIFLTTDEDVAGKAQKLGAVAYLRKPITADRLLEVVGLFASQPAVAVPR